MSYGRHQSFYIKETWVTKAIKSIESISNDSLINKARYKDLGLGKNMHQSLRFWVEVMDLVKVKGKVHEYTTLGKLILNYDVECLSNKTILLLHFMLVSDYKENCIEIAHGFYWFFNECNLDYFNRDNLRDELINWNGGITATNTITKDIDCIALTYTKEEKSHPEDKNVSFFAKLGLLKQIDKSYVKNKLKLKYWDYNVFYYILVLNIRQLEKDNMEISLDSITNSKLSLGKIFNFNKSDVIDIVEKLISDGKKISINRTNNLDIVKIEEKRKYKTLLRNVYGEVN